MYAQPSELSLPPGSVVQSYSCGREFATRFVQLHLAASGSRCIYGKSSIFPDGFGDGYGSVSGVTRTAVVNLNGYFPPLG
jgi:hypothetical protein